MKIIYIQLTLCFSICLISVLSSATTCNSSVRPTGFTQVNVEKSFFYSDPKDSKKKKSYLVKDDFVQVLGKQDSAYVCVVYRRFGYGGKKLFGWMHIDNLKPVRQDLKKKDLIGTWILNECYDGSCMVDISDGDGKLTVNFNSYLHDRLDRSYTEGSVSEKEGGLVWTGKGSGGQVQKFEIKYLKTKEPGAIEVVFPKEWAGLYHR